MTPQRSPTAARRRPRDRKEQIARAAATLFHDRGYHGVGVDEIAAVIGISGPAVYRHFPGKHALLSHVVFDGADRFESALADGAADQDHLDGALRSLARTAIERREVSAIWQREVRSLDLPEREELRRRVRGMINRLGELLRNERPELTTDECELLARAALAVLGSPSFHHVSPPGSRFEELLQELAAAVCAADLPVSSSVAAQPSPDGAPAVARATRRELLLDVAIRLFNERGLRAVSMDEIGEAAGIAGPSVYRHFASKDELLSTVLFRGAESLHLCAARALAEGAGPRDALHRLLRSYVEAVHDHRDMFGALFVEAVHLPEEQRRSVRRAQSDYVAEWLHLRSKVAPGEPEAESAVRVHSVLAIVNHLTQTRRFRGRESLKEDLQALGRVLLD
jgi:AcrR family transcriptional regulator